MSREHKMETTKKGDRTEVYYLSTRDYSLNCEGRGRKVLKKKIRPYGSECSVNSLLKEKYRFFLVPQVYLGD